MAFEQSWSAEILPAAPMIQPARSYVWPTAIAGEEDALARGAVFVNVRPSAGGSYLLTCALGFKDPTMPRGILPCPAPDWLCVLAGGYAYLADASRPETVTLLGMKPVVQVLAAEEEQLLLFVGFQTVLAWGAAGKLWETARLSWEGVRITSVDGSTLRGFGWDLMKDLEVEFVIDLRTGSHTGGAWNQRPGASGAATL